jgi:hypothetical protein
MFLEISSFATRDLAANVSRYRGWGEGEGEGEGGASLAGEI